MKLHVALMAAALAVALLAPSVADAHRISSSQSIGIHARAADRALAHFETSVKAGLDAKAARALARNRREMRAAVREQRRVLRSAKGNRGAKRRAAATIAVGVQADANAGELAELLDEVDGDLKADVAVALHQDLLTGARALGILTGLVDDVPVSAQGAIVQAIGALAYGESVVAGIVGALSPAELTADVEQLLVRSLGIALATVDAGTEALNGLVAVVTGTALPLVEAALATATSQLQGVAQTLQGVGGLLPGLPALGGGSGSIEIGVDGSQSVSVSGLCGLVGALPFTLPGC